MKRLIAGTIAGLAFLCTPLAAQDCSTLSITTQDNGTFQTVTVFVDGSFPDAFNVLAVGQTPGTTVLDFRYGTLTLGLDTPFSVLPLGMTDDQGDVTAAFDVPVDLGLTMYGQSVGYRVDFGPPPVLEFCTSNVASVDL